MNQPTFAKNKNVGNANKQESFEPESIFNRYVDGSINNFVFNLVPIDESLSDCSPQSKALHVFDAFLFSKFLNDDDLDEVCQLSIVNLPPFVDTDKLLFVRIRQLKQDKKGNYFDNCLFVHKGIFDFAKIPVGCKAKLTIVEEENPIGTIKILTNYVNLPVAVEKFKQYLTTDRMVFTTEFPFYINDNMVCSLQFEAAKFVLLDWRILTNCKLIPVFSKNLVVPKIMTETLVTNFCNIGNMEQDVFGTLKMVFESQGSCENILLVGKRISLVFCRFIICLDVHSLYNCTFNYLLS